jgi:general secretion pathway protein A
MYESFYGFREKPFSILPDPAFLFPSRKHQMALSMLEYGLTNQASFTVVTGEIGSGKTTLVRKLLQSIDEDLTVGLVSNTQCASFEEFLRWILFAFELEYRGKDKVELYHTFTDFLIKEFGLSRRVILIIDEAQHLGPKPLEQLRMLSNVNADKYQILQLILIGQPDLRRLLSRPELEQFVQRISVDYHLKPLDIEETEHYIRHRLNVAGGDPKLFTKDACLQIGHYTGGVPRLINILCDTALVYGFAEQKPNIDIDLVNDVVRDKQMSLSTLPKNEGYTQAERRKDADNQLGLSFIRKDDNHIHDDKNHGHGELSTIERLYRK